MVMDRLIQEWEKALNEDGEINRRVKPFRGFCGGKPPKPGPGPYEPANVAVDPGNWAEAEGYSKPKIDEFEQIVQLTVSGKGTYTIEYSDEEWSIEEGEAEGEPVLDVEMPFQVLKDLVTSRERVVWALSEPENEVSYKEGVAFSDWSTVFMVFVVAQEMIERNPDLWEQVEEAE